MAPPELKRASLPPVLLTDLIFTGVQYLSDDAWIRLSTGLPRRPASSVFCWVFRALPGANGHPPTAVLRHESSADARSARRAPRKRVAGAARGQRDSGSGTN